MKPPSLRVSQSTLRVSRLPHRTFPFPNARLQTLLPPRPFSSTTSQRGILDTACSSTFTVIDTIHATTGLSWALTLPLTAILVRTFVVLPFSLWATSHSNRLLQINPIIHAWRPTFEHHIMSKYKNQGPEACHKLLVRAMRKKRTEVYKSFGVKRWPAYAGLVQIPIWLLVIETIRKMCGTREGLLGVAASAWNSAPKTGVDSAASSVPLVESLATEGALWFPDLLASDPQLVLPFVLSGTMFANIYSSYKEAQREGRTGKWSTRLNRILMTLALALGPLTLHLPSAMLVYWIASAGTGLGQKVLISKIMPKPLTATPCKPRRIGASPEGLKAKWLYANRPYYEGLRKEKEEVEAAIRADYRKIRARIDARNKTS